MGSGRDHGSDAPPVSSSTTSPPAPNGLPQSQDAALESPRDGFEAVRASYPPILTTAQVADLLDLNPRTVLNMAGDGRLPASRLPGSRKFHFLLEEIIDTLKANRVTLD